jgi:thiol-disulfide isomerase/thioredoxin
MKKIFGVVACAAAFLASALMAATPRPLADVAVPVPNGKAINLKTYRGKVLLFAMISTECAPCIASVDILNRAQKDYGPKGFQAVAAAGDQNAQYTLGLFQQRYRPNFPMGYVNIEQMMKIGDMGEKGGVAPVFLFVDRKGIVQHQFFGDSPFFKQEEVATRKVIEEMLKQ